jgi:hypothetical protein
MAPARRLSVRQNTRRRSLGRRLRSPVGRTGGRTASARLLGTLWRPARFSSIDEASGSAGEMDFEERAVVDGIIRSLIDRAMSGLGDGVELQEGSAEGVLDDIIVRLDAYTELGGWFVDLTITLWGPCPERLALKIARSLCAMPPETWQILPRTDEFVMHAKVTLSQLEQYRQGPQAVDPDRPSHLVFQRDMPRSLVEGTAVRAWCGLVFTPTETGEPARQRSLCEVCALVYAVVKEARRRASP